MNYPIDSVDRMAHERGAAEVAALERAASGVRDAFEARSVYGALLASDGILRFTASSPVDAGLPASWVPGDIHGVAEALETGIVTRLSGAPLPAPSPGPVVLVPLLSRGRAFGALVIIWAPDAVVPALPVLALVGSQLALALDALRNYGMLAHEVATQRDATALLDGVFEVVSDAVKVLDLDGRVLYWGPACEGLYGWTADEVLGERMPHVPADMRLRAVQDIRRIAASGQRAHREAVAVRKDGSQLALNIDVVPFLDRDGHPAGVVSASSRFTGERKSSGSAEELVAVVSQSLKGPLTAIVGFAQLLTRPEIFEDPARRARTIRALEERGSRMSAFVDDLLLATRLEECRLDLDIGPTDLAGVVTDVVSRFEEARPRHGFVIDYDAASMGPVMLDRRRIEQALSNLLDNAVRLSPPGTDITVGVRLEGEDAVVEVTDLGPGVAPEDRELLFERFGRIGTADGSESEGPGLGLYLVRMIAEAHGGSAMVSGEAGKESTFAIRIPVRSTTI